MQKVVPQWWIEDFFTLQKFSCPHCGGALIDPRLERGRSPERIQTWRCAACSQKTRVVRSFDLQMILRKRTGGIFESVFGLGTILAALDYQVSLLVDYSRPKHNLFLISWQTGDRRHVALDPAWKQYDNPLFYEQKYGVGQVRFVLEFGFKEIEDKTSMFVSDFAQVQQNRRASTEWAAIKKAAKAVNRLKGVDPETRPFE